MASPSRGRAENFFGSHLGISCAFPEGFTVIDAIDAYLRARQGHTLWEGAKIIANRQRRGHSPLSDHAGIFEANSITVYNAQFWSAVGIATSTNAFDSVLQHL